MTPFNGCQALALNASGEPLLCRKPPMYVTRHSHVIDRSLIDGLWLLYERAYVRTAEATVTHEMLDRIEFTEQLADHANRVWVLWSDERPVGMALISTDVNRTRWLSERYFKTHFPDRYAAGQVHYVVWVTIDPAYVASGAVGVLATQALAVEAADGALLVFDVPDVNQPESEGGAAELMIRLARSVSDATLVPLGTQRYFAVDFPASQTAGASSVVGDEYIPDARDAESRR